MAHSFHTNINQIGILMIYCTIVILLLLFLFLYTYIYIYHTCSIIFSNGKPPLCNQTPIAQPALPVARCLALPSPRGCGNTSPPASPVRSPWWWTSRSPGDHCENHRGSPGHQWTPCVFTRPLEGGSKVENIGQKSKEIYRNLCRVWTQSSTPRLNQTVWRIFPNFSRWGHRVAKWPWPGCVSIAKSTWIIHEFYVAALMFRVYSKAHHCRLCGVAYRVKNWQ